MSNRATGFIMFVLGAAAGSAAAWYCAKKKYELIAQAEIDSVKDAYRKRDDWTPTSHLRGSVVEKDGSGNVKVKAEQAKSKPNISEYTAKMQALGYTDYSGSRVIPDQTQEEEKDIMKPDNPYVISPDEFGEQDGYDQISLTYYADLVLADENDEPVYDLENVVGRESLTGFGEYEDDSVFVRNDRLKCDYEILLDQQRFADVVKRKPREVDG